MKFFFDAVHGHWLRNFVNFIVALETDSLRSFILGWSWVKFWNPWVVGLNLASTYITYIRSGDLERTCWFLLADVSASKVTRIRSQLCSCFIIQKPCCFDLNRTCLSAIPLPGPKVTHLNSGVDRHCGSWLFILLLSVRQHEAWWLCLLSLVPHLDQIVVFGALLAIRLSSGGQRLSSNCTELLDLLGSVDLFVRLELWICLTVSVQVLALQAVESICLHDPDRFTLQPECFGRQWFDIVVAEFRNGGLLFFRCRLTYHRYSDFTAIISFPCLFIICFCQRILSRVFGLARQSEIFLLLFVQINVDGFHDLRGLTFVNQSVRQGIPLVMLSWD